MNDTLGKYYDDIGKYDLLTRKEESDLFLEFHKWWRNRAKAGQATRRNGRLARERLINSNLRLVAKIAQKYTGCGIDLIDLIQEGNEGLIISVEKFKMKKGCKLSTYSQFWIRQKIIRSINNKAHTIRLPVDANQKYLNIIKFISSYKEEFGEEPSNAEIIKKFKVTEKKLKNMLEVRGGMMSLDYKMDAGNQSTGETEFGDILEDEKIDIPSKLAELTNNKEILTELLNRLPNRERHILYNRFGLANKGTKTLEEIGDKLGVTRERVRQLETVALRKLRQLVTTRYRVHDGSKQTEIMWSF